MMDRKDTWRLCRGGWRKHDGNQEQEQIQVQGSRRDQEDGDGGGEMQKSYPEEKLRKEARKARREHDARVGAHPSGELVQRPVVKKLWVAGRASQGREEWAEEVWAQGERCYDE